jgi:putative hydrolase of the HAD superfamily
MTAAAVFFDVDFTLIRPGPTFRAEGYQAFCARHGMSVDAARFVPAVASAAQLLDLDEATSYDAEIYVAFTRHIIEQMGGAGESLDACAREIYEEWAANRHFDLYDDVAPALEQIAGRGMRIGLISNSHRCLRSFQSHFALDHLVSCAVSSSDYGFMKPHPNIFRAAMELARVSPEQSVMVGDSVRQDIDGALKAKMRAVFLHRDGEPHEREEELLSRGVPTIRSLAELPALLAHD